ncbi:CapA family protein [Nocardioides perillae]|uniref:Poly-gamma-glutamate synthesis protein (Capsule biosynthesis protein) n=1 Tax=Nocardioides perillae TaxID=1119534 RepID=A0A7Y9RVB1_9ACTN|nr:CapA family protein [Nocardioides perillae]NYG55984.1 poly-gamma-glutamate synthesis protein (capsule biosynthesis protein) [Nocardioides perillae]
MHRRRRTVALTALALVVTTLAAAGAAAPRGQEGGGGLTAAVGTVGSGVSGLAGAAWPFVDGDDPDGGEGAGDDGPAGPVTLAFAGDVHFEGVLSALPGRRGATLGPLARELRAADVAVVNLEGAVTTRGRPASKELEVASNRYWFRHPPSALRVLERSGVDVASLANNHGADYGVRGLRDALAADAASPVALVGVGRDHTEAFAPECFSVRGTDVAVLAADSSPRESRDDTWAVAPGTGAGLAAARDASAPRLLAAVRAAAAVDDVVVVYLHWGEEGRGCPTGLQRDLAAALAEAGADVVVGTHAHVLQGAGGLGGPDGTYVSYGLGNFAWYHGRQGETGVLTLRVERGRVVDDRWTPGVIPLAGGVPERVTGRRAAEERTAWRALRGCTDLEPGPGAARDRRALAASAPQPAGLPAYSSRIAPITAATARRMRSSHDPATCPTPLRDLRLLTMSYVDFAGRARTGEMVVHREVARDVVSVFADLYAARWPLRRMVLVDEYAGSDDRSMAADNTSGYNCRRVAGQTSWSDHAYGKAVDLNPVENPYVTPGGVLPPAGRRFVDVDRSPGARVPRGVIRRGDVVTRAFARIGWEWGGAWAAPDYQHFSAP